MLLHPVTGRPREYSTAAIQARLGDDATPAEVSAAPVPDGGRSPAVSRDDLPPALARIIRPEARLNWINASVRLYTPEYIAMVLRLGLTGDLQQQWQLFHWMEDTWPRLNKNLLELKRAVAAMDRSVTPHARRGEQPTLEAEDRADVVQEALFNMRPEPGADENGFNQTIFDLLDAWGKGVSVLEIDWDVRGLGLDSPALIAPRCTRWVHPTFYGFSPSTNKLGLRLGDPKVAVPVGTPQIDAGLYEFPPDKFLLATCKARSTIVPAAALLRPLAFWWCASNFTAEWLLNFAQIFGTPIRWAQYAQGISSQQITQINDMLANMGNAAWGSFPAGTSIELKEATKTGADNPQAFVQDLSDRICDILILGQTLTTDVGNSGSRSLGQVHKGVRDQIIEAAGAWVDEIINQQLVPAILRLNYGDATQRPKIQSALRAERNSKAMAERDQILLAAGVRLPKAWLYARHDIPMPAPGERVVGRKILRNENEGPQETLAATEDTVAASTHELDA